MSTTTAASNHRTAEIDQALTAVSQSIPKDGTSRRLVAVSKYKPASDILAAHQCSQQQRHFGENYVQELCEKASQLPNDINWHFIGRLQSNKCKTLSAIPNLWAVETIDGESKACKLNDAWRNASHSRRLHVYIQVNTSGEVNKGGAEPNEVESVARVIRDECQSLQLLGLMTIGSVGGSQQRPNPDFLALRELRDGVAGKLGLELELSMGMSDDFEHALELGSNSVRVGSRIFGGRPPK